ncbi:DUF2459 domain-containing protein [Gramella lutea]|uniref:DUF2459 domain-containing protein n=1 Tax=Christiangramia lutea TaxID=1607951 RepID=A0A9X1V3Q7_9FLAO|nr:DUF2459 domain-containing protein [Christiangramia lutea]MCH4823594.1 DUF2459 domain-containing protein [Christiangramia lutea]
MKRLIKSLGRILFIIISPVLVYAGIALFGALIPVNRKFQETGPIQIFVTQNGLHTDIVLPVSNHIINWENYIKPAHFPSVSKGIKYYSFGWGDLEFFKKTPSWEDLELKTGLRTLFKNTPSAIHIYRLKAIKGKEFAILNINEEQYKMLVQYILKHLENSENDLEPLDFRYSENDVFYRSDSEFNLFRTCNTWVNNALKYSGIRTCLWTPFAKPLFWQLNW